MSKKSKTNAAKAAGKRPAQDFLMGLVAKYEKRTAPITDEMAMDLMDTNETNHFLMLLQIADYLPMGKSRAILNAYKLGYLAGKAAAGNGQD